MPDLRWDESKVERVLEWGAKAPPHHVVGSEPLRGLDLDALREMFGVGLDDPEDPPMFNGYAVEPRHVGRLQEAVTHEISLDRFDYVVAAFQRGS
jgi:hypothetical protein